MKIKKYKVVVSTRENLEYFVEYFNNLNKAQDLVYNYLGDKYRFRIFNTKLKYVVWEKKAGL